MPCTKRSELFVSGALAAGAEATEAPTVAGAWTFVLLPPAAFTLSGLTLTAQSETSKIVATVMQIQLSL